MRHGWAFLFAASAVAVVRATDASYDYIVVGSGPGGGPLACDLARAGYSTLLIEAGDDQGDNPTYADLANFNQAGNDELSRWDFWTKHSDDAARELKFEHTTWRLPNGSFYVGVDPPAGATHLGIQYPRAATLGGCASKQPLELIFTSFSHVWINGDKGNVAMWTVSPETSLFKPFRALSLSLLGNY